ncbi:sensor histidine kinase [Dictyobacter arantiisoli]|uniref:histidine kinase n=1 Tax=Dictyobacter arantiisoli TaxID=2014874 RepID=A0A5A5TE03_9CHLR|nr:HAMP domain-containing sensor histidine kinase [Dictyobacter arantiisoli]GCF09426.1 hypothetical protein KDI_29900 [Dictyobacter arantiisoli]
MGVQEYGAINLLTTLSHELRTPLAVIKGYATTLMHHEHKMSKIEQQEFLQAILQASERLESVVNQILEIQQLEEDALPLQYTSFKLYPFICEVVTEVCLQQQQTQDRQTTADIQITTEGYLHNIPWQLSTICGDRTRLKKALKVVLENALSYSPQGSQIVIGLRANSLEMAGCLPADSLDVRNERTSASPVTKLEIWVRDTGIGIEPQQLQKIFEHFHRIDTRLTREVNGLGLGLALCKRIVELHHGTIWAESEVGKGSIFHILLPVTY